MKTLHLTNYWHERSGGIATFYRQLLEAAKRHKRDMVLIVPGVQDEVHEVGAHGKIYKIAAPPSPLNAEYRTIYPREFLLPGSKIQKILAAERPDLVEICDKYSLVHLAPLLRLGLARGVGFRPIVIGLTCERMDENFTIYVSRSWWGRRFVRFYMRHVYFPAFDHHIAVSRHTAVELRSVAKGHLVPRGVWIMPMGVEIDVFSPARRNAETRKWLLELAGGPQNALLLLYVGRLAPEKNLGLLTSTLAQLEKSRKSFRLIVVGDGIARESLEHAAQSQVPGKVVFLGHIADRDELSRIYASCDFFVHPNPTEPFGIAPLEAMASGLVLIVPDRGGIVSYANNLNAYLAPPTPDAFAQAIMQACQDENQVTLKTRAARETANSFAWSTTTGSFLRLYKQLCNPQGSRQAIHTAAFVSSTAAAGYAASLKAASKLARVSFSAYARVHQLMNTLTAGKCQYETERKAPQPQ
jgi:alpha-1,6-mannosyltransferase